jgi:ligand-binding sensor domain-containing protein
MNKNTIFLRIVPFLCCFFSLKAIAQTQMERVPLTRRADDAIQTFKLQAHLPHYAIRKLFLADNGVLWAGTEKGLVRYNGTSAKLYAHDPKKPKSIGGGEINGIIPDSAGGLWLSSGTGGLSYFNPQLPDNQAFKNYFTLPNNANSLPINEIWAIAKDDSGKIWAGGNDVHLTSFDPKTGQFERFESPDRTIFALLYAGKNQLFIATRENGVLWFDTNLKKFVKKWDFKNFLPKNYPQIFNSIRAFALDTLSQTLWMATLPFGVVALNLQTEVAQVYETGLPIFTIGFQQHPMSLHLMPNHQLWVGYNKDSLLILDYKNKQILSNITQQSLFATQQAGFTIQDIQYDAKQNLAWLATNKGLWLYNPKANRYNRWQPFPNSDKTAPKIIAEGKKNQIWLLKQTELQCYDTTNYQLAQKISLPKGGTNVNGFQVSNENLFLRANDHLWRFDPQTQQFKIIKQNIDPTNILLDTLPNGIPVVWVSTWGNGLYRFSNDFKQVDSFFHKALIISMSRDSKGKIWMATDGKGLWRMDDKINGTAKIWLNDPNDKSSLPENVVINVYADPLDRIWVGTMTNGVAQIENPHSENPTFKTFSLNALENPFVESLKSDADGMIWIMGQNKPTILNPKTGECLFLTKSDPLLPDIDFKNMTFVQGNNCIWLASDKGIMKIASAAFLFEKRQVRIEFNDFKIFDKSVSERLLLPKIHLSPKENYFSATFSANDFEFPERVRYKYQLEGFDEEWRDAGSTREVHYSNLDGGDYTLKVYAVYGDDAEKISEITPIYIGVEPPFWKTKWFFASIILLIGSIVGYIFYQKLQHVKRQAQLTNDYERHLNEVRMSALRSQMNPHFIFNCLNTIEGHILQNEPLEASNLLQKFAKLIRKVLENSQFDTVSLEEELEALRFYTQLEEIRHEGRFKTEYEIEESVLDKPIPPMILQPFVENAILHGLRHLPEKNGQLWIRLYKKEGHMICEIEDNGIGRRKSALLRVHSLSKTSLGLKITKERLAIFNPQSRYEIIDLQEDTGTIIRIYLN